MDQRVVAQLPLLALSLGVMIVGLIVSVLIHELAHIVVGYASGLRVARVQIGPLEVRDYGRPRVRLVRLLQAGVVLAPFDRDTAVGPLRWGLFASTAAGPLAGVALGAVAIWLAGGVQLRGPLSLLQSVGQASLVLGILNLLPIRTGDSLADGRRTFALVLRTQECGHIVAATMMLGEALSGRRPRDWDPGLLGVMERTPDEPFARLCLYEAAMDRGEIEAAGRHLDAAVDLDHLRARAEAAVLFAEGRALEGRQRAVAGLASLERARRRDEDLCRDQLEELARGAGALVRPLLSRAR